MRLIGGGMLPGVDCDVPCSEAVEAMKLFVLPQAGNIYNFEYFRLRPDGPVSSADSAVSTPLRAGGAPTPPADINTGENR